MSAKWSVSALVRNARPSTELAANLFRATQAEEKLRRDEVRGTMPEQLPAPDSSIGQLASAKKNQLKKP